MSMDHPSVNAPAWSFWRVFSTLSLGGSLVWTATRPFIVAETEQQLHELLLLVALTAGAIIILALAVVLYGGVRMGQAESTRLAADPDAIRAATSAFGPTRIALRVLGRHYGIPLTGRFLYSWALVEVSPRGVTLRRAHEDAAELLHIPAERIVGLREGAMVDSLFRIPTLNVEVGPSDESIAVPFGLLSGPVTPLSPADRLTFIAEARRLLGLPVGS